MLNTAFDGVGAAPGDYYPAALRAEIDALNARIYDTRQQRRLQGGLRDHPGGLRGGRRAAVRDARLAGGASVARAATCAATRSPRPTWRLFTTLVRFDAVYHGHFKCNLRRSSTTRRCGTTRATLPDPGVARDRRLRPHQAALLRQPRDHQPDRHRAARAACSTSTRRTGGRPSADREGRRRQAKLDHRRGRHVGQAGFEEVDAAASTSFASRASTAISQRPRIPRRSPRSWSTSRRSILGLGHSLGFAPDAMRHASRIRDEPGEIVDETAARLGHCRSPREVKPLACGGGLDQGRETTGSASGPVDRTATEDQNRDRRMETI